MIEVKAVKKTLNRLGTQVAIVMIHSVSFISWGFAAAALCRWIFDVSEEVALFFAGLPVGAAVVAVSFKKVPGVIGFRNEPEKMSEVESAKSEVNELRVFVAILVAHFIVSCFWGFMASVLSRLILDLNGEAAIFFVGVPISIAVFVFSISRGPRALGYQAWLEKSVDDSKKSSD